MAVGTGVTEIADSEEELLTSSPAAVSDAAVDKLSTTAGQDAQAVACLHQELAEHPANQASSRTDLLDTNQRKPSKDVESTHSDHPDLQSAHQTETNNTSACATETLLIAGILPQTSLDAAGRDHQASCSGADGETGSLRDIGALSETKPATQLDERAVLPTNNRIHIGDPQNDHHQPYLQEHLPVVFQGTGISQLNSSKEHPQDEAVGSHTVTLKPSHSDHVQPATNEREPIQHDDACDIPRKDLGAAESKALAVEPSRNISHEATIGSPNLTAVTVNAGQTAPDTANILDPMNLDALPGAPDLTATYAHSAEHETAAEVPASQGVELQHVTESEAVCLTPRPGAELIIRRNDHEASNKASSAPGSAAQSKTTARHDLPSEQCEHNDVTHETATDASTLREIAPTQVSATSSNELAREQFHPVGSENVAAERLPEILTQSTTGTTRLRCEHGPVIGNDRSLTSKASDIQTETQSTASQSNESGSPRPAASLSPQEITLAELKAQKTALLASLKGLPAIQVLIEESQTSGVDMSDDDAESTEADIMAAANKIVKEHIKLLHEYNELKDVGQGLMGLIADQRGVRIVEVQDEFGIDADD